MSPRIAYTNAAPGALQTMYGLEIYLAQSSIEARLLESVFALSRAPASPHRTDNKPQVIIGERRI